ncbi:DUF6882 domain-containing protein [Symmachiella dynata]|uniref:DUF6882 domain-containing protein n=1 Tax=Symmachiella dynata TaxID=2527995 RepID=UPI0030EE1790
MIPSSRTPEGTPNHCPLCGNDVQIELSTFPTDDAPCPHCGHLLWSANTAEDHRSDFEKLLSQSLEELIVKNTAQQQWGLGANSGWDLDQESGGIVFHFADGFKVFAPVQIIGSLNVDKQSWLWAWANPSILDPLTQQAEDLKSYGELHEIPRLMTPVWSGTNELAWAMAAFAAKLCGATGAYRAETDKGHLYMTFGEVEVIAL